MLVCLAPFLLLAADSNRVGRSIRQCQAIRPRSKTTVLDLGDYDVSPENDGAHNEHFPGWIGIFTIKDITPLIKDLEAEIRLKDSTSADSRSESA